MKICAVVGLGYVGLDLAVSLAKANKTIGYDLSKSRIQELQKNYDRNLIVSPDDLKQSSIQFTFNVKDIKEANFYIVSVSTPAYYYELPNLEPLINATKSIGAILKKGDVVVYESTVYPGTTEEICIPILENLTQLRAGIDFHVGYSPERISPGDKTHHLKNIPKIISAQNPTSLEEIKAIYLSICDSVYPVSNIKTAEAIKILENTQRDINIAFMNEFAQIIHALHLDMSEIIEGCKTKWNFIPFKPGFVGGHCIAVDPQYLVFKARRLGLEPKLIPAARQINDGFTHFIIREMNKILIKQQLFSEKMTIGLFGITYKENVPDIRNSLSFKLIKELKEYGYSYQVNDPLADKKMVKEKHNLDLLEFDDMRNLSVAIIIVQHDFYRQKGLSEFIDRFKGIKLIMDIPNLFIKAAKQNSKTLYWSL